METLVYRYFVRLDYNGAPFHGWQIQPNAITVQELLQHAFSHLLKEPIPITGCGRTDTGVNAKNFMAHFDSSQSNLEENETLIHKLNRYLPNEILIHKIKRMHTDAHSRFDATQRTYKYYVSQNKSPFLHSLRHYHYGLLNIEAMNQAANKLFDYIDFTSFSKVDTDVKTNNCVIKEAFWAYEGNDLVFTISADRFLRNMVRAIVGTLLNVGKDKISVDEFCQIIESKNRSNAGSSVPGKALFLIQVNYPYPI
jgi:tRNA pseudouridine38-40 synthase